MKDSKSIFYSVVDLAIKSGASDIHLSAGLYPVLRVNGELMFLKDFLVLDQRFMVAVVEELLSDEMCKDYRKAKNMDASFEYGGYRFRVHVYRQQGSDAVAMRLIPTEIPAFDTLNLPLVIRRFTTLRHGLILVTGTTGSGKSTTLASLINEINLSVSRHIITIEDPIEYVYRSNLSIIRQREVGHDVNGFADAVRAAMREDPDVVLVGEMRDLETIQNTITLAETGHLVFATLHTKNVAETVDRIVDVFPSTQQQQIRLQLSNVLEGVVSQHLLPRVGGGRVPACEVMVVNDAIRALIREQKNPNAIYDQIQINHRRNGSQTLVQSLANLYNAGLISYDVALEYAVDAEMLKGAIMAGSKSDKLNNQA